MKTIKNDHITQALSVILANTYVLYLKTQNFHWNVSGIHFSSLHALFEDQYNELAKKIDTIAEQIRILGHAAPGSFVQFHVLQDLATLQESTDSPTWQEMLQRLAADHQAQNQLLQRSLQLTSEQNDEVTAGLFVELQAMHQKMLWVLNMHSQP